MNETHKHKQVDVNSPTDKTQTYIKFDPRDRMSIFIIFTAINIVLNMDHGTIPAATKEIQEDMDIKETTLGSFGSLVYLGNLIGALILTKIIDAADRKLLAIVSVILNAILLFCFINSTNLIFLSINRILVGLMQCYLTVYFPVWIDQFGPRKWKTMMLSIFNITSPFGVIFGYILTMVIKTHFNVSI